MHPCEVERALGTMAVLIDTREKEYSHITQTLDKLGRPWKRRKLNAGDYSCEWTDGRGGAHSLENQVVIERKAGIDELAGNLTKGRERFRREFSRAAALGAKVYLLLENTAWEDIEAHRYRSLLPPKAIQASLWSWQEEFGLTVATLPKHLSGLYIQGTLFYALKKRLLKEST